MTAEKQVDFAIIGGGLVGLMAAHEIATIGQGSVALIAPAPSAKDGRTTAMLMPTVERLKAYGVWDEVQTLSAPLRTMRLIDGSRRLLRAPLTEFEALELCVEAFGYNVPNAKMTALLEEKLPADVKRITATVHSALCEAGGVTLRLDNGETLRAGMAIAADGKDSLLREAAGITLRQWDYPQTALVTNMHHTLPHNDVSTEFHTETGPFTVVPLPPKNGARCRSSLVWVVRPEQAKTILAETEGDLARIIEQKMQSILGRVELEMPLQTFPLSGQTANAFAANGVALVGEAAHVFPPIGAQGFNLGVRDVVALAKALADDRTDPLPAYSRARQLDINGHTFGVDLLNRSLLTDFLPVQAARTAGMATLGAFPWLRKTLMRRMMGVSSGTDPAAEPQM
jgi:2-octaprenyl-6-methoxyphenol hydroxylase